MSTLKVKGMSTHIYLKSKVMKKLTFEIEIQERNTPSKWTFSEGTNGIEMLALWNLLEHQAKEQKELLLNKHE